MKMRRYGATTDNAQGATQPATSDVLESANDVPSQVRRERWRHLLAGNSIILVAIALLVVFTATRPLFITPMNLVNILRQMAVVGAVGIGMTLVILLGGIDLSVGSVLFLAGGATALLLQYGTPAFLAIFVGLLAASLVGLLNGLLVEVAGISPVIVTLGSYIGVRGAAQELMHNAQIPITDSGFNIIAFTHLPPIKAWNVPGIPLIVLIVIALYIAASWLIRVTSYGRMVYAIGGNPRTSKLSGLPVVTTKVATYVLCSFFAGIGGILMIAQEGIIGPSLGAGIVFYVVAAVVLGGTSLTGGVGRIEKTFIGSLILYMIFNYMTIRHIATAWQQAATGLILLGAIVLTRVVERERAS